MSIVRRQDKSDHWRQIKYVLFDAPGVSGPFEERQKALSEMIRQQRPQYAKVLDQARCAEHRGPQGRTGTGRIARRRRAHAQAAGLAVRSRPLDHVAQGQDLPRCRRPRRRASAWQGPSCRAARCRGRGTARRPDILGRHGLFRCPTSESAGYRQYDYLPLPGNDGSWRAAVPVVRACAGRRGTAESGRAKSYSFQTSQTTTQREQP